MQNNNFKHGYREHKNTHPLYRVWDQMKSRCYNPNVKNFKNYGGRGITVCAEWENDPVAFIEWSLKNGYRKGLQIDRENNDGNYSPDNCRFISNRENSLNSRLLSIRNNSGYRGVCWQKNAKMWQATIRINRKQVYLGLFRRPRLAALRYDVEAFLNGYPMNFAC